MPTMPTAYILVGVPASGKSTWLAERNIEKFGKDSIVLSTDYYIDALAAESGKTYNEVFHDAISWAQENLDQDLEHAIENGLDIYWDQTNATAKSRARNMKRIPAGYRKVAVFFETPENSEWVRRLNSRPGKTIPQHVLNSMRDNLTKPTKNEGFSEIIIAAN